MGQDLSPLVHAWFCLHNESYLPHYTPGDPLLSPRPGLQSVQKQRLMNKNLEPDARKEPALLAWTSPVLGGGGTEVKRWRPKRPGHLAAILEPEPGKEEQREPRNSPKGRCFLRPRFLLSTSSRVIHTLAAAVWLVLAPWVWMSFLCGSSGMKLEMTISASTEGQTWRIKNWLQY